MDDFFNLQVLWYRPSASLTWAVLKMFNSFFLILSSHYIVNNLNNCKLHSVPYTLWLCFYLPFHPYLLHTLPKTRKPNNFTLLLFPDLLKFFPRLCDYVYGVFSCWESVLTFLFSDNYHWFFTDQFCYHLQKSPLTFKCSQESR